MYPHPVNGSTCQTLYPDPSSCLPNHWLRCSPWLYCSKSTIVYIFIFGCSIPVRSDCHDVLTSISCVYRLLWPNHVTSDMSMLAWNVSEWFYDILESSQSVSFLMFRHLIMISNLSVKWIGFTRECHGNWIFNKKSLIVNINWSKTIVKDKFSCTGQKKHTIIYY